MPVWHKHLSLEDQLFILLFELSKKVPGIWEIVHKVTIAAHDVIELHG